MKKKHMISAALLILSCLNTPFAPAAENNKQNPNYEDYLFPLKNSNGRITGSFAEHRGLRFHAGIDFSTDNKTGYEVISVNDAILHRVKTSYAGYGKAVYLKLKDGNIVVYAHLKDFSDKINAIVKPLQKEKKSFWIDKYITQEIKIDKGELIGFSGASGGSVPHLHFETRDEADRPFNLLKKPGIYDSAFYKEIHPVNKEALPLIQNIFLIPLNENSYINGKNEILTIKPHKKDSLSYYIKEDISIFGKIAIAVYTYEAIAGNKIGPRNIALNLNDKTAYNINLNSFSYSQYNYGSLIYSLKLKQAGFKNTVLLAKLTDYDLPITQDYKIDSGVINTADLAESTPIKAVIDVTNSCDEQTVKAFFTLHKTAPQIIKNLKHTFNQDNQLNIQINIANLQETAQLEIAVIYNKKDNKYKTLQTIDINQDNSLINFTHTFKDKPSLIAITPRDKKGALHTPYIISLAPSHDQKETSMAVFHNTDRIEVNMLTKQPPVVLPKAKYTQGDISQTLELMPISPSLYSASIYTDKFKDNVTDISIVIKAEPNTEKEKILTKNLKLHLTTPENNYLIPTADELCYLKISPNSFFTNTYISTEILNEDFVKKHIPKNIALSPSSLAYKISPTDLICRKKFNIGIKGKKEDLPFLGLYYLQGDKWVFDGKIEASAGYIESRTRVSGVYCLLKDSKKPVIKNINPIHDKKDYVKIPKVSAVIYDNESGLNNSKTELWINGKKCAAEYDSNKKMLSYNPEELVTGINTAKIIVTDNVGNTSSKVFTFGFKQE